MIHVLVVEDDKNLNSIVVSYLKGKGWAGTTGCLNPSEAFQEMGKQQYDLIISDIMMPGMDGFQFAKEIRSIDKNIPILFMTARDDFDSKKNGYDAGIDDYMVKPINLEELAFHMQALLRRAHIATEKRILAGNLVLDEDAFSASVDGKDIPITLREFRLLFKLLSYPQKTFSRSELMDEFWDEESDASFRAVDMYITKLREKFSSCDGFSIKTIHGLGYKGILK